MPKRSYSSVVLVNQNYTYFHSNAFHTLIIISKPFISIINMKGLLVGGWSTTNNINAQSHDPIRNTQCHVKLVWWPILFVIKMCYEGDYSTVLWQLSTHCTRCYQILSYWRLNQELSLAMSYISRAWNIDLKCIMDIN